MQLIIAQPATEASIGFGPSARYSVCREKPAPASTEHRFTSCGGLLLRKSVRLPDPCWPPVIRTGSKKDPKNRSSFSLTDR